jgi:hypothetical protein
MSGLVGSSSGAGDPGVKGDAGATENDGVQGFTSSPSNAGVIGVNNAAGVGVHGVSEGHDAVQGHAKTIDHAGVLGHNAAGVGVVGVSEGHDGVQGFCSTTSHAGVVGSHSGNGDGVLGQADSGAGVHAISKTGPGLVASGTPAGSFDGDVHVTGDVILEGADYAEALTVADQEVLPGMTVVLDEQGLIRPCSADYDPRVAGVIAGARGVRSALVLDRHDGGAAVALMGKAWALAEASELPIRCGDLLTTSATPGHARRADDMTRAFGCIIGKALTSLDTGRGFVRVLVNVR